MALLRDNLLLTDTVHTQNRLVVQAMLSLDLPPRNSSVDFTSHDYKVLEMVGKGQFGRAYRVQRISDNAIFLAKAIDLTSLAKRDKTLSMQEAAVMKELDHPNVVKYYESFIHLDTFLVIVMEYCERGDMSSVLEGCREKESHIDERDLVEWLIQLVDGLKYIHEKNIIHRDLKPSNILLDNHGNIKIGDFGISRVMTATLALAVTAVGTPQYMSPEMCENKPYTFKSDIWALGCVLYEMATLRNAFEGQSFLGLVWNIAFKPIEPLPKCFTKQLSYLVSRMLSKDPQKRPFTSEILSDPLILQYQLSTPSVSATLRVPSRRHSSDAGCATIDFCTGRRTTRAMSYAPASDECFDVIVGRIVKNLSGLSMSSCLRSSFLPSKKTLAAKLHGPNPFQPLEEIEEEEESTEEESERFENDEDLKENDSSARRRRLAPTFLDEAPEDAEAFKECLLNVDWLHNLVTKFDVGVSEAEADFLHVHLQAEHPRLTVEAFIRSLVGRSAKPGEYVYGRQWAEEVVRSDSTGKERSGYKSLTEAFRQFDSTGDGGVSRQHFRTVLHLYYPKLSSQQLDRMYQIADKKWKGAVLYERFMASIHNVEAPPDLISPAQRSLTNYAHVPCDLEPRQPTVSSPVTYCVNTRIVGTLTPGNKTTGPEQLLNSSSSHDHSSPPENQYSASSSALRRHGALVIDGLRPRLPKTSSFSNMAKPQVSRDAVPCTLYPNTSSTTPTHGSSTRFHSWPGPPVCNDGGGGTENLSLSPPSPQSSDTQYYSPSSSTARFHTTSTITERPMTKTSTAPPRLLFFHSASENLLLDEQTKKPTQTLLEVQQQTANRSFSFGLSLPAASRYIPAHSPITKLPPIPPTVSSTNSPPTPASTRYSTSPVDPGYRTFDGSAEYYSREILQTPTYVQCVATGHSGSQYCPSSGHTEMNAPGQAMLSGTDDRRQSADSITDPLRVMPATSDAGVAAVSSAVSGSIAHSPISAGGCRSRSRSDRSLFERTIDASILLASEFISGDSTASPSTCSRRLSRQPRCERRRSLPGSAGTECVWAAEGRARSLTNVQQLIHTLQLERVASCREVTENSNTSQNVLTQHRELVDLALTDVSRTLRLACHAQSAATGKTKDRAEKRLAQGFADAMTEASETVHVLTSELSSQRDAVDCLASLRDPSRAASPLSPSSSWSGRFAASAEFYNSKIMEVVHWCCDITQALLPNSREADTYRHLALLKEQVAREAAFVAAMGGELSIRDDWEAARIFMELVGARKFQGGVILQNGTEEGDDWQALQKLTQMEDEIWEGGALEHRDEWFLTSSQAISAFETSLQSALLRLTCKAKEEGGIMQENIPTMKQDDQVDFIEGGIPILGQCGRLESGQSTLGYNRTGMEPYSPTPSDVSTPSVSVKTPEGVSLLVQFGILPDNSPDRREKMHKTSGGSVIGSRASDLASEPPGALTNGDDDGQSKGSRLRDEFGETTTNHKQRSETDRMEYERKGFITSGDVEGVRRGVEGRRRRRRTSVAFADLQEAGVGSLQ